MNKIFEPKNIEWYRSRYNLSETDINELTSLLPYQQFTDTEATILRNAIESVVPSIREQGIKHILNMWLSTWKDSYNKIKGEDWPDCNLYSDFEKLPINIQEECRNSFDFSPEIWIKNAEDFVNKFPLSVIATSMWSDSNNTIILNETNLQNLIRIKRNILDNSNVIKNQRVLEFGCFFGDFSYASISCGATHVVCTDVRNETLNIAKLRAQLRNVPTDVISFEIADLHNYENNFRLSKNADTVIISGVMYHVHDHYAILESIANARPKYIVIETVENDKIKDIPDPVIVYDFELSFASCWGWYNNQEMVPVGTPNSAWFDFAMQSLKYKRIKKDQYEGWFPNNFDNSERSETRSIHVYQVIQ